jgi:hypothetical protein
MMIQFGFFTKYGNKLMRNAMEDLRGKLENESVHQLKDESVDQLETLVRSMGFLLEFDFNYVRELSKNDFRRTYKVVREERKIVRGYMSLDDDAKEEPPEEVNKKKEESMESQKH